jgi:CheY-like chemotaxis protein
MILIVDDDPINARVLRQLLERLRFTSQLVPTGGEALAFLAESPVDLIICSLVLPDMDGFTLLSQIMDRPYLCDVPVMVCTGTVDPASVSRAVAVGAADVVMKPVRPEALAARLERVLRRAPVRWEARSTVVRRLRMNSHDFHALLEMASGQLDHLLHALDEALNIVAENAVQSGAPGRLAVSEGEALDYLVRRMRDAALYVGAVRCASMLGMLQPPIHADEQDILTLQEAMRVERASFDQALASRGASLPRVFAAS